MLNVAYFRYGRLPGYAVVSKKGTKLAEEVDQALGELKKEGKIAELEKKYFGEELDLLLDKQ